MGGRDVRAWGGLVERRRPKEEWRGKDLCSDFIRTLLHSVAPSPSFPPSPTMAFPSFRRRSIHICLSLLALFLLGTVVVLSSVSYYLSIPDAAYITEQELDAPFNLSVPWNATEHGKVERIPRILHQTWKSETLPDRWKGISQECRDMMPE